MNSMGNLEKLGILVIVILVVVVGVVAITPKRQINRALSLADSHPELVPPDAPEPLPDLPEPAPEPIDPWPDVPGPEPVVVAPPTPQPVVVTHPAPEPVLVRPPVPVAPTAPRFRDYTVRGGDTLSAVARRELGSAKQWRRIAKANPSLDPNLLRVGDTVRIPMGAASSAPSPVPPPVAPLTPVPGPSLKSLYVVKKGDTLSGISQAELGTARRWKEILDVNRGVLSGPQDLQVGMKLKLPGASGSGASGSGASGSGASGSGAAARAADPAAFRRAGSRGAGDVERVAEELPGRMYKVRKGDTLSAIARRELGAASRWRDLLAANPTTLHGSHVIRPGMRLRLPD